MAITAQSADGVLHQFPDGTPDDVVDKVMKDYAAQKAPAQTSLAGTAADVARAIPGGVAKGVSAIVGLPGDLQVVTNYGLSKLGQAVYGRSEEERLALEKQRQEAMDKALGGLPQLPTSTDVAGAVSKPFGGFYQPQTVPGQYAETAASFAPSALAPGGLAQRAARVLTPAVTSETAGQLTKGTPLEPYARVAGALGGGLAQGLGEGVLAERARSATIPTTPQLKAQAQAAYQSPEVQNLVIAGKSFDKAVDDIAVDLQSRGINSRIPQAAQARLYPKGSAALEILQDAKGQDISLNDLDKLRQVARISLESNDKADRAVGHAIIDGIDDFVGKLKPADVVQGDAPAASAAITTARDLWTRMSKSDVIDRAIQKAQASTSQFTGAGYENALRVQFRNLAKNDRAMRQFSPAEKDAIRKVAAGGPTENLLRFIGKFSPHGFINAVTTGGVGYAAAGLPGAAAGLAVGEAGRQGATALTARNARLASEAVRSGVPAVRQLQAPVVQNALRAGVFSRNQQQPFNAFTDFLPIGGPLQ